jgi:beta-xylosidase
MKILKTRQSPRKRSIAYRVLSPVLLFLVPSCGFISPGAAQSTPHTEYHNPILWGDYSDPDVIRVGNEYLLVASTFSFMPGIPVLKSTDLLHWTIIGHVFPRLDIDPRYSMIGGNRYGRGAWAPAIRFHAGRYYVYFPTPDEGIFMSSASSPAGPWTPPVAVLAGPGYEDPCPFWDDDGQAYLIHSRVGAGPLILHHMSPDGRTVLDAGTVIERDAKNLPTLEGPKLYKRDGYYYIFAPYGGVSTGAQAVLRSRSIEGPYEVRTVLAQGSTSVNGPHQGGYIETPDGKGWFLHFHSAGAYGRIDYLEPVRWDDGWPVIGKAGSDEVTGEPVSSAPVPVSSPSNARPATSDEFSRSELGLQWEWNHNPEPAHWSLEERRGFLRLYAMPAHSLQEARNTLTEMGQDPAYSFTVALQLKGLADGQQAGVAMFSERAGSLFITQDHGKRQLHALLDGKAFDGPTITTDLVQLRVTVSHETATYAWSTNEGKTFQTLGTPTPIFFTWWKAARPAIFTFNADEDAQAMGYVDVDWAHYAPLDIAPKM